jgi:hypothetical protein
MTLREEFSAQLWPNGEHFSTVLATDQDLLRNAENMAAN